MPLLQPRKLKYIAAVSKQQIDFNLHISKIEIVSNTKTCEVVTRDEMANK